MIYTYYGKLWVHKRLLKYFDRDEHGEIIIDKEKNDNEQLRNCGVSPKEFWHILERIDKILNTESNITEPLNAVKCPDFSSKEDAIIYSDVSFTYSTGEEILHRINLNIKQGQTIAFVGESGSGKTTIANLLPRFYDVTSGAVMIDGVDIRELRMADLRNNISFVFTR